MGKKLLTLLSLTLLFAGCERTDIDPEYPTIYKRIASSALEELRIEFAQNNVYLNSTLNEFGFCSRNEKVDWAAEPPKGDTLTENEVIEIIKTFITQNPLPTGVSNPNELIIVKVRSNGGYPDSLIHWTARSSPQMVDTIEVLDTEFLFRIKGSKPVSCQNNWFPIVHIPKEFQVDLEKAKSSLVDKVVSHFTIAGIEYKVRILPEHMEKCKSTLKILPMWSEEKIELRVVWELWIDGPVHYKMYIDVMNGNIVREAPTIIT